MKKLIEKKEVKIGLISTVVIYLVTPLGFGLSLLAGITTTIFLTKKGR